MVQPTKDRAVTLARGDVPLHRQIYEHFRKAITAGQLRPGDRLPSSRALGQQLAVARGTVDTAYAMLAGEGYILSRRPLGSIVSPELPSAANMRAVSKPRLSFIAERDSARGSRPFRLGLPAFDAFPRKLWSGLVVREARELSPDGMAYPDPAGYLPLREAVAAYLVVSRGILCDARQVVITSGYQGALDLVGRVLLRPKDQVWFEDPCYHRARQAFEAAGARLMPIRVDGEGLRVQDGVARARDARLAVVTPSHQSPLGVALSLPRRLALLAWADKARAFVVEDDYDSEFRYVGRPLPALKSLDRKDRVLYAGSFSKVLFPGLRLGYLVLPEELIGPFTDAMHSRSVGISPLEQRVVAAFMTKGYFARHLKRMRNLYADRRRALAEALATLFGDRLHLDLKPGGMHLIVRWSADIRDTELAQKAEKAGLGVEALSSRAIKHRAGDGLLLGFTNLAAEDALSMCRRLEHAIGGDLRDRNKDRWA
jgi:GntR family transcriptional regulator/MocR family aminotransferase